MVRTRRSNRQESPRFQNPLANEDENAEASIIIDPDQACYLRNRGFIEVRMNALQGHFMENGNTMSVDELETRKQVLEECFVELSAIQGKIEASSKDPTVVDGYMAAVNTYCELRGNIQGLINALRATSRDTSDVSVNPRPAAVSARLPKIDLPKFSGKLTEWIPFSQAFNALVDANKNLSNIDKFLYLKSSLTGSAAQIVNSLDITSENYGNAMQALKQRFSNSRLIFNSHIDEMVRADSIKKGDSNQFASLVNSFGSHFRAMKSIGTEAECLDAVFIYLLSNKVDTDTAEKWESSLTSPDLPTFQAFHEFLIRRSQTLDNLDARSNTSTKSNSNTSSKPKKEKALFVNGSSNLSCPLCNDTNHTSLSFCSKFKALDVPTRFNEVKTRNLCNNCLSPGHVQKNCQSKHKCKECSKSHHTLLHRISQHTPSPPARTQGQNSPIIFTGPSISGTHPVPSAPSSSNLTLSCRQAALPKDMIFGTALVFVNDSSGNLVPCRTIVDCAAGPHFVSEEFALKTNLPQVTSETRISGIGSAMVKVNKKMTLNVHSRVAPYHIKLEAVVIETITSYTPQRFIDTRNWNIPKDITLADPEFYKPSKIDLLIGVEYFLELLRDGQIQLGENLPRLQNTILGYIIMGRSLDIANFASFNALHVIEDPITQSTDDLLERFWTMETVDSFGSELSVDDAFCEDLYSETTKRDSDGRYIVKLPFLKAPASLGDSFQSALKQFYSLERRLNKNLDLKTQYASFVKEFLNLGHMTPVSRDQLPELHYFMPHHAVIKPTSSTTRLRVVFNASATTSSGTSLNKLLGVGPPTQDGLFANLIRFRLPRYALCADITKMYRQVSVDDNDTYFQLILWRDNPTDEIQIFRMTRVTYGTAPAAYLSTRTLNQLALDHGEEFPLGAETLLKHFYVDDMLSGDDNIDRANQRKSEVVQLLQLGGFVLKKWCSNTPELLHDIPQEDQEPYMKIDDNDVIKTLGLIWNPEADSFKFTYVPLEQNLSHTKRSALRDIARIYDLLGLINPVVTLCKIFMQNLWSFKKLGWDDALPEQQSKLWQTVRESLVLLKNLSIPRIVLNQNGFRSSVEVHGFSDASMKAFSACVYIRTCVYGQEVSVRLLCAKSKVAPVKTQSVPRLELCGALLLAQLTMTCLKFLDLRIDSVNMWTDSTIVLAWLKLAPNSLTTFVANRVAKLQDISQSWTWRHVPTDCNPADLNSRGMLPKDLSTSELWFEGPSFLKDEIEEWPKSPVDEVDIPEKRSIDLALIADAIEDPLEDFTYANSYNRILGVYARMIRLVRNHKATKHNLKNDSASQITIETGCIKAFEYRHAEIAVIRPIQKACFTTDYLDLLSKKPLTSSSLLIGLSPLLDKDNLIRVGGRLHNANLPLDERQPIILPKKHPFTRALILRFHLRYYHLGARSLLSVLRQRYWIVNGITTVTSGIRNCVYCQRRSGRTLAPIMGNLPLDRVDVQNPGIFTVVGKDYAGPFDATFGLRGRTSFKVYMALFVCFHTKAVHIDIVTDLTARAFIQTFKIFQASRGKPSVMYSDNATNFIGARNMLSAQEKEAFEGQQDEIRRMCSEDGVEWRTIPARSPHMGGIWEAAIKQAKRHFAAAIGSRSMNIEDLRVVAKEVEAILNSRPLFANSNDPKDAAAVTPAHILLGRPLLSALEPVPFDVQLTDQNRYRRIQAIRGYCWKRLHTEHLQSLQLKAKWRRNQVNLKVNTLVTLKDDNLPPLKWTLGRVVAVHPGNDGVVRVASVRVGHSILKRAVRNLAPIEPWSSKPGECSENNVVTELSTPVPVVN